MPETGTDTKEELPRVIKPRPIVRLGRFLISHSFFFSIVCCFAGVLALLLLPVLSKNTYVSENALMPGSASSMLSNQDVTNGNRLVKDVMRSTPNPDDRSKEVHRIVAQYMSDLGAEVNYHRFYPESNQFNPLHFFSNPDSGSMHENVTCLSYGSNAVGIIRAPRGDGRENIVLVTRYNSANNDLGDALSLGIAYSAFSLLSRATWLAKDIIWLVADSRFGDYAPVSAWLRDYHRPSFTSLDMVDVEMCRAVRDHQNLEQKMSNSLRRAGTIAAALVLKVENKNSRFEDTLSISAEASNGQMPNLDLINIVNYLAVHRQGFHVEVDKFWSLLNFSCLKILGGIFEFVGKVARCINPEWKVGISAADYVEGTATLASSFYYQALGVPTGPHGAFRDYQVDAITLNISPKFSSDTNARRHEFVLRGGRLIEGVVRSVNNLLEKFHQSFFLYMLTSPSKFVSVGVYMIPFALLITPLPMVAASLYTDASNRVGGLKGDRSDELGTSFRSWKWLNAAKQVFIVQLWSTIVSLLPRFINEIPGCTPTIYSITWIFISILILGIMRPLYSRGYTSDFEWAILKSVTISTAFIGLCLVSVINFAAAEIGALLIVPMCLMAHPFKLDIRDRRIIRMACNLVLGLVGFPPVVFFMSKGVFEGFNGIDVGHLWTWVETLWAWNSATYLFISMIHLPCWLLCVHILSHTD